MSLAPLAPFLDLARNDNKGAARAACQFSKRGVRFGSYRGRLRFLQLLKMQLANAATVGLGHSHAVVVDLYLLALFRQMPEQVRHVAADSAHVRIFQFELREIVQLIKPERAVHRKFIRVDLFEFFLVRRSEEHTSELQSLTNLVCRLLLEK